MRDSDADRECRTVLKQLKLAVKNTRSTSRRWFLFLCRNLCRGDAIDRDGHAIHDAGPRRPRLCGLRREADGSLERVEQRLKIGVGEIARAFEDDGQEPLKPYASARGVWAKLRLVLENARAYNERFRRNPHNVGYNICLAVDAVQPVLEEALFQFASKLMNASVE